MAETTGIAFVDRKALYEEVWSTPGRTLAKKYGVSDVALAKACRRHKIPRPPRGHWAKLAAGKPSAQEPLPALDDLRHAARGVDLEVRLPDRGQDHNRNAAPVVGHRPRQELLPLPIQPGRGLLQQIDHVRSLTFRGLRGIMKLARC